MYNKALTYAIYEGYKDRSSIDVLLPEIKKHTYDFDYSDVKIKATLSYDVAQQILQKLFRFANLHLKKRVTVLPEHENGILAGDTLNTTMRIGDFIYNLKITQKCMKTNVCSQDEVLDVMIF